MKRAATRRAEERVSITPLGQAMLTQHLARKAQKKCPPKGQRCEECGAAWVCMDGKGRG